jgi:anti-anti-sigma factor
VLVENQGVVMSVLSAVSGEGSVLTITIKGKFNFEFLNEFRQAYSGDNNEKYDIVVDVRDVTSIDSSALGMLLLMQCQLNKRDGDIRIINCNPVVRKILRIVRFDKKFSVE